ncbi:MAG TPA: hypothetical protein VFZ73_00355 [Gemmatimonadaceae bacterium]
MTPDLAQEDRALVDLAARIADSDARGQFEDLTFGGFAKSIPATTATFWRTRPARTPSS